MLWPRRKRQTAPSAPGSRRHTRWGWLTGLIGSRHIDNLIDENFPSWEEYSAQKVKETEEQRQAERFELPPYRVSISSPLQRNFLYALVAGGAVAMGYADPAWASILIYGAIFAAAFVALFTVVRDGIFLHLEGQRLEVDGDWINRNSHGPEQNADGQEQQGFLRMFGRKKKTIFRSRLLQIHYQNVLRAFDQGARRAWVYQDASIGEIQTLLTQRGMKVAWTVIEVLPQLGLLGTLIGLTAMFLAFRNNATTPDLSILSGFGTALGTTLLANMFVLILRPLHMQNERTMNEILSTLQTLMAVFILPTQQYAMERAAARAGTMPGAPVAVGTPALITTSADQRVSRSVEQLAATMKDYMALQEKVDNGAMARETARVATEVQSALRSFQESVNPEHLARQQQALVKLTDSVQGLAKKLEHLDRNAPAAAERGESAERTARIEHDLTQLRVLTRDTLVLLGQIANRLSDGKEGAKGLLSLTSGVQAQLFPEAAQEPFTEVTQPPPAAAPAPAHKLAPRAEERPARPEERVRQPEVSSPKIRLVGER